MIVLLTPVTMAASVKMVLMITCVSVLQGIKVILEILDYCLQNAFTSFSVFDEKQLVTSLKRIPLPPPPPQKKKNGM